MFGPLCDLCGGQHPTEVHLDANKENEARSVEKRRAERSAEYLRDLFVDQKFVADLVEENARASQEALVAAQKKLKSEIDQAIAEYKNKAKEGSASSAMEIAKGKFAGDPKADLSSAASAAKTLRKEWANILNEAVSKWKTDFEGQERTVDEIGEMIRQKKTEDAKESFAGLEAEIASSRERTMESVAALQKELDEKKGTPEFIKAVDVWGASPDSKNERGPDGKGLNAGMAHYFEYRRSKEKSGRFAEGHDMTVDSFIEFSQQLRGFIENPDPKTNPDVQDAKLWKDELGQRRLMAMTKKGMFISAFQSEGEPMRVITGNQKYDTKRWAKDVSDEADPEKTKGRLNQLGNVREAVEFGQ